MKIMKLCLNYGCVERNSREYRKALRQCRKNKKRFGVAFDDSETWNMDLYCIGVVIIMCIGILLLKEVVFRIG